MRSSPTRYLSTQIQPTEECHRRGWLPSVLERTPADRWLWVAALCAALADLGTTALGLRVGLVETNPIGVAALAVGGVAAMVVLKLLVTVAAVAIAAAVVRAPDSIVPDYVTLVVPTALAAVWLPAAVWNASLIATTLDSSGSGATVAAVGGVGSVLVVQFGLVSLATAHWR